MEPANLAYTKARISHKRSRGTAQGTLLPPSPRIDFSGRPQAVLAVSEAWRLAHAYAVNPVFATEISAIDPLPHQRIAVYERMLPQEPLRFLLADDAGAGKTIMAGLYIREALARDKLKRVIIIPPAGLVGNWQRELKDLFQLDAIIVAGRDLSSGNPFAEAANISIIGIDTLRGEKARKLLKDAIPYDLAIFDEAHKLSCDQGKDFRASKSERYRLAEMLAGPNEDAPDDWRLPWQPEHLLLLTATPHMGKDYPYYALWRLLDSRAFSSPRALASLAQSEKENHFIRRTKEEMRHLDGSPLYPMRVSDTLGFALSEGERRLYDATTDYLLNIYNKALVLNPAAARLALSVFQRRLSSSTYALKKSFERRKEKLADTCASIRAGLLDERELARLAQKRLPDPFEDKTADEEKPGEGGREENELAERDALAQILAASLADIEAERESLSGLIALASEVLDAGAEAKFKSLLEIIRSPRFSGEKILIFTEHRDTLEYLAMKLEGYGFAGQLAFIHGGMDWRERQEAIENFRKEESGAKYMICTDAAAEGVNLQFCWIMINYDIPWNPARLEQRMGRVHRYGQKHDPVFLLNLVATSTREGKVLATLLEKLERIRAELSSDKVFDSIGRVFANVSIKSYMERALLAARANDLKSLADELDCEITQAQLIAASEKEAKIFGEGGDIGRHLPALRESVYNEQYRRLLPGYVEGFMRQALPLLGASLSPSPAPGFYQINCESSAHAPAFLEALGGKREICFRRKSSGLWTRPGEPFFEAVKAALLRECANEALAGAIFIDPEASEPALLHLARYSLIKNGRPVWRLAAIRASADGVRQCAPEELLCLIPRRKEPIPPAAQALAKDMGARAKAASLWFEEAAANAAKAEADALATALPEKLRRLRQGFAFENAELSRARKELVARKKAGEDVEEELALVMSRIAAIEKRKRTEIGRAQSESVAPGEVHFIAHALLLPANPASGAEISIPNIEELAMRVAASYESQFGEVYPVHTPELARARGLPDRCGFDLLSRRPNGSRRCIEVKGTRGGAYISMTENEWSRAMNLGDEYWLYIVANCASPDPRLLRIQNPVMRAISRQFAQSRNGRAIKIADIADLAEAD